MKMPFGDYKGVELDDCPNSLLQWVAFKMKAYPPETVKPEKREAYHLANLQMKAEARRVLRERARNKVHVPDTRGKQRRSA